MTPPVAAGVADVIDDYRVTERTKKDGSKDVVKDDWRKEERKSATSQLDGQRVASTPAVGAIRRGLTGQELWTGTTTFTRRAYARGRVEPARWGIGAMMLMTSCLAAAECKRPLEHEVYHIVEDPGGV